jgi:hypothetical protein
MKGIRRLSAGLVIAAMVATGLGTATLEAKKGGNGGGNSGGNTSTVCTYLRAIIDYEYTSPYILTWAWALYNYYDCTN